MLTRLDLSAPPLPPLPTRAIDPRGSRGAHAVRWAERLLVAAGTGMLIWCALVIGDARLAQRVARESLAAASSVATPERPRMSDAAPGIPAHAPIVFTGSAVADLSIPRVHLSAVVLHGSDAQTLRRGPGHLEHTALPGESGHVVIAGHRDSFFRPLEHVQVGDDIFLDTPQGHFHYRVTSLRVVHSNDLSVLAPTGDAVLTLITCYPFWVLGAAPDRFVVRATGVPDPASVAFALPATRPFEPIAAPATPVPDMTAPALSNTRIVRDDEGLVRETIERYRLTYNARLISREDGSRGPLMFQRCEVRIGGDRAAATCGDSSQSADGAAPDDRTFTLERTGEGWAIRLVGLR